MLESTQRQPSRVVMPSAANSRSVSRRDFPSIYNGGFLRDRHQLIVFPAVAVHPEVAVRYAFFKTLLDGPACVLGNAAAFLLCKRSEKGQHQLAVVGQGVNVLLLELYLDAQLLQVPDRFQQVHRVSGKPADGFGEDDVDLSRLAVIQQPFEFRPAVDGCTGDEVVGVDTGEFPLRVALDELVVVADLCGQGMHHPVAFHRYTSVGSDLLSGRQDRPRDLDFLYSFHGFSPPFPYHISL